MKTAVIHCGVHKTGSSSVQAALAGARAALRAHGYLYPHTHPTDLSLCFRTATNHNVIRTRGLGKPELLAGIVFRALAAFDQELAADPDAKLILSHEDFSAPDTDLQKLVDYLHRHGFDDVRLIVYLRDHLSYRESTLQQRIKGGEYVDLSNPDVPNPRLYQPVLEAMERVVPKEKITVRAYDRPQLKDGDVVADFQAVAGLQAVPLRSARVNESLSAAAMTTLNELNRRLPAYNAGGLSVYFEGTVDQLRRHKGDAYRFAPDQARQLVEVTEDDRRYLAEHWFGGKDPFAAAMAAALDDPQRLAKPVPPETVYDLLAQLYAASQLDGARQKRAKMELECQQAQAADDDAMTRLLVERLRTLKRRLGAVLHSAQRDSGKAA